MLVPVSSGYFCWKAHTCIGKVLVPFDAGRSPYQDDMKMRSQSRSCMQSHGGGGGGGQKGEGAGPHRATGQGTAAALAATTIVALSLLRVSHMKP